MSKLGNVYWDARAYRQTQDYFQKTQLMNNALVVLQKRP
jgi:hypothetical protein